MLHKEILNTFWSAFKGTADTSQSGGLASEIRGISCRMLLGGSTPGPNSNEIQYTTLGTKGKFQLILVDLS